MRQVTRRGFSIGRVAWRVLGMRGGEHVPIVTIRKCVECVYFGQNMRDVQDYLLKRGDDTGGLEVVPLWSGFRFKGFAIFEPEQYDYFHKFLRGSESPYVGFYDSVRIYERKENAHGKEG